MTVLLPPAVKDVYELTKLDRSLPDPPSDPPITHTHVFHKEYPRLRRIDMPDAVPDGELYSLLYSRESSRLFSDEPVPLDTVSKILLSCGISDPGRRPERRTYPSAGARFPVEIYLISFNIAGIDRGAYHYNVGRHCLELLLKKDLTPAMWDFCSPYIENAAAAVVFTAVIPRSAAKYWVKSYPYSLIEAGHMCQNIHLACTKFGVRSCPIGGFVNDSVSEILDLTPSELPVYTMGMGLAGRAGDPPAG